MNPVLRKVENKKTLQAADLTEYIDEECSQVGAFQ